MVGRKRADALRLIVIILAFLLPFALLAFGASFAAASVHLVGVIAQRWLFFAEAEHVVGIWYGRTPVTG